MIACGILFWLAHLAIDQKNDRLPDARYLENLIHRNKELQIRVEHKDMLNYQQRMLRYVYSIAKINGYDSIWKPSPAKSEVMV